MGNQSRYVPETSGEQLLELVQLGQVIDDDIGLGGVFGHIVLVVIFGGIKGFICFNGGACGISTQKTPFFLA